MLINCFNCGKSISSKKDLCVYCKQDVTVHIAEMMMKKQGTTQKQKAPRSLLGFLGIRR